MLIWSGSQHFLNSAYQTSPVIPKRLQYENIYGKKLKLCSLSTRTGQAQLFILFMDFFLLNILQSQDISCQLFYLFNSFFYFHEVLSSPRILFHSPPPLFPGTAQTKQTVQTGTDDSSLEPKMTLKQFPGAKNGSKQFQGVVSASQQFQGVASGSKTVPWI